MDAGERFTQRQPGGEIVFGREFQGDGLVQIRIASAEGLAPGQLLHQVARKRPLRLVEQLRQLAGSNHPWRAELQLPPLGLGDEDFQQPPPGTTAGQGKHDILEVQLPAAENRSISQSTAAARAGPLPIQEDTLDAHFISPSCCSSSSFRSAALVSSSRGL